MVGTGKSSGGGAGVFLSFAISWQFSFCQPYQSLSQNKGNGFSAVVMTI
jgi:hypothetical protein